jgi:hypothetical protein
MDCAVEQDASEGERVWMLVTNAIRQLQKKK